MTAPRDTVPKRCNKPASRYADNGYRVCEACHKLESAADTFTVELGIGRCDRPTDGLGAARLERSK